MPFQIGFDSGFSLKFGGRRRLHHVTFHSPELRDCVALAYDPPNQDPVQLAIPYFGRVLPEALNGERQWEVHIFEDDCSYRFRELFEKWVCAFMTDKTTAPKLTATVQLHKKTGETDGEPIETPPLVAVAISPIELDWGSHDQLESFDVTFVVDPLF